MDFPGEHLIFLGSLLVVASILAGMVSNRIGAPLLLVFLGLGMLAGEDGAGIVFSDFQAAFLVGSLALAIILFDGGMRTNKHSFEIAGWPALVLATGGVLLTTVVIAVYALLVLDYNLLRSILIGAIVSSTDAAAVFLLLHLRGTALKRRVGASLEIESGLNDPMAVLLTVTCVSLLRTHADATVSTLALEFLRQLLGGALIGVGGGFVLVWLINRIEIASGLYPILALSFAVALFGGAQWIGASGFLTVYLAGVILGNRRHRAAQVIARFHDGLAWLAQIGMFLMLGLLVSPHALLADLWVALGLAFVLIFIARPLAVWLCLLPFRFEWQEITFVGWVGLRGAVPIFLATLPVFADLPGGRTYFSIAFVVVLTSLLVQGWTVTISAKLLDLVLPPSPEETGRVEIDAMTGYDRDIAGYRVDPRSPAVMVPYQALALPRRSRILSVIRRGVVMPRETLAKLEADDYVLAVAPPENLLILDQLFAARVAHEHDDEAYGRMFGEFVLDAGVPAGETGDFYGFPVQPEERDLSLAAFAVGRLHRRPVVGDRLRLGPVELVVREMKNDRIQRFGLELEPEESGFSFPRLRERFLRLARRRVRRMGQRLLFRR